MSRLEKIQQAILALPEAEYKQLRHWFSELDWKNGTERLRQIQMRENWIS